VAGPCAFAIPGGVRDLLFGATYAGQSPLVANGALYCASNGHIRALDPVSGALLWQDTGIGSVHWSSPVVVNGVLYISDKSRALTAYAPTL